MKTITHRPVSTASEFCVCGEKLAPSGLCVDVLAAPALARAARKAQKALLAGDTTRCGRCDQMVRAKYIVKFQSGRYICQACVADTRDDLGARS